VGCSNLPWQAEQQGSRLRACTGDVYADLCVDYARSVPRSPANRISAFALHARAHRPSSLRGLRSFSEGGPSFLNCIFFKKNDNVLNTKLANSKACVFLLMLAHSIDDSLKYFIFVLI
jgi:hypothetical protein